MTPLWPFGARDRRAKRLWLDLGRLGDLVDPSGPHEQWQDHGGGLLRTILHQHRLPTDVASTRACANWDQLRERIQDYDMLLMNVRCYTYGVAREAARLFKKANPAGKVLVGGLQASVALDEMEAAEDFDKICQGPGEGIIVDLVRDPDGFPRVVEGVGAASMDDWPTIDRTLWPQAGSEWIESITMRRAQSGTAFSSPSMATICRSSSSAAIAGQDSQPCAYAESRQQRRVTLDS